MTMNIEQMKEIRERLGELPSCKLLDLAAEYIETSFEEGYTMTQENASGIVDFMTFYTERDEFEATLEEEQEE